MIRKLDRKRREHPFLLALAEGFALCVALAFANGLLPQLLTVSSLAVLVWSGATFTRGPVYQVTMAVILGLFVDLLSSNPAGESLAPLLLAMIAANMWVSPTNRRWEPGHLLFAAVALAAWTISALVLGWAKADFFGPAPHVGDILGGVAILVLSTASAAGLSAARQAMVQRRPRASALSKLGG